jgi:hypothetical protein
MKRKVLAHGIVLLADKIAQSPGNKAARAESAASNSNALSNREMTERISSVASSTTENVPHKWNAGSKKQPGCGSSSCSELI